MATSIVSFKKIPAGDATGVKKPASRSGTGAACGVYTFCPDNGGNSGAGYSRDYGLTLRL